MRALAIQAGIGIASGLSGIALLFRRPSRAEAAYPLRIAGMMMVALGLLLMGFAVVFVLASAE